MKPTLLIVNGPNLNLTGRREPEVYGTRTMDEIIAATRAAMDGGAPVHGYKIGNLTGQLDERGEIVPVDTVLQIRRLHAVTAQCHINPAVLSVSILVLLFT